MYGSWTLLRGAHKLLILYDTMRWIVTGVCYDLLSRSICMHFPFVCGLGLAYASNQHFSHIFTSHHNSSHNYTTGRGIYTHSNTCSPARVQHAYNDTTQSYITQLTQWWTHHSCKSGSPLTQFSVCIVKHSGVPLSALGFSQINNLIWLSRTLVSVMGE